jgi:RNA polymerase sigma-70 factor (ECF subfamily)
VVVPLFEGATALSARSDDELMLLARGGRREAFDQLVRRHQRGALQLAARYLGNASFAREAAQNAFVELHRGLDRYRPRERFAFYLKRVVLNQCRMLGRSMRIRERALENAASEPARASAPLPDEALLAREHRLDVDRALQTLSPKLREVVALRYAGEHSLEEVGEILGLPLGTVKSRLFSALEKLRDALGERP